MRDGKVPVGAAEAVPDLDQAREWLGFIPPRPQQQRARVGFAMFDGWGDHAEPIFVDWVATHPEHDAKRASEARTTWQSARKPGAVKWPTLRGMARDAGWHPDPNAPRPPLLSAADLTRQQAERQARADAAALDARQRLATADPADPAHQYLKRKGGLAPTPDMRQEGGVLLVPVCNLDGDVRGVQVIDGDGNKRFSRGTATAGALWWAQPPAAYHTGKVFIVEGVATGLTVAAAIDDGAVTCAFNAGNVPTVAAALRARYPAADIIVAADADAAGRTAADKAVAAAPRVSVRMPVFAPGVLLGGDVPTDFNDVAQLEGLPAVRRQLLDPEPGADPTVDAPPPAPLPVADPPAIDETRRRSAPSVLDRALSLAGDAELFHDTDGSGYITLEQHGHREIWPLDSRAALDWLHQQYYCETGRGLPAPTLKDALATLKARARFDGPHCDVFLRVARLSDRLLIDCADPGWRVIEITARGWRVLDHSPVAFIRRAGMAALPEPKRGGGVDELRAFINVADTDFHLVVGWLLAALNGRGPFPVLILQAEQGAGKSTAARVLRALVDPAEIPLKAPPRTVDDLIVTAASAHVLALDNLSGINHELADALCRLATGGGISKRRLYSDLDEVQLHLCRPALLNGIDAIATRPDLADRALVVNLPSIAPARRQREAAFWCGFEVARPRLLGALLDGLVGALQNASKAPPPDLPRMADFAAFMVAAEPALGWSPGSFLDAYQANIEHSADLTVEASPVGVALLNLLHNEPDGVRDIAQRLMAHLEHVAPDWARRSQAWPKSPRGLTDALRRLAAPLRQLGISIEESRDAHGRWISIKWIADQPTPRTDEAIP